MSAESFLSVVLAPHFLLLVAGGTWCVCCLVWGAVALLRSMRREVVGRPASGVVGRRSEPQGDPACGGVVRSYVAAPVVARPARPADPSSGCDLGDVLAVAAVVLPPLIASGVFDSSPSDSACDGE